MRVSCGHRVIVGGGEPQVHLAMIMVANTGERPFKISAVSIRRGFLKRHHGIIKLGEQTAFSDRLLVQLNDGDESKFGTELDSQTNWVAAMKKECKTWLDVASIRITIHCTNGQKRTIKPERHLLNKIYQGVKENSTNVIG